MSRHGRYRYQGLPRTSRTPCATGDPMAAWRGFVDAARAAVAGEAEGPGMTTRLLEARKAAIGSGPVPVAGEDAKACADALSLLAQSFHRADADGRGHHAAFLAAGADCVSAMLDRVDFKRSAIGRRCTGDDD